MQPNAFVPTGAWVSPKAYAGAVPAGTVPLALPPPTGWSVGAGGGGTTVVVR